MSPPAAERPSRCRAAVFGRSWGRPDSEAAFVLRGLAGALSRHCDVDVFVTSPPGPPSADGLFDLQPIGDGGHWPPPAAAEAHHLDHDVDLIVVEPSDKEATILARRLAPKAPVISWGPGTDETPDRQLAPVDLRLSFVAPPSTAPGGGSGSTAAGTVDVGFHVPVNPAAGARPHTGFGFVDYLLVLTDGRTMATNRSPTGAVAWITARFPGQWVVVIEAGAAEVWRGRARRGAIAVDNRADLWRLMAHARTVIDLQPGPWLARECVEAMYFATPVVVPARSAGAAHAAAGGGLWFADVAEMLGSVEALGDSDVRRALGRQGQTLAKARYGAPQAFVTDLGRALATVGIEGFRPPRAR